MSLLAKGKGSAVARIYHHPSLEDLVVKQVKQQCSLASFLVLAESNPPLSKPASGGNYTLLSPFPASV